MQAAATRGRRGSTRGEDEIQAESPARNASEVGRVLGAVRQTYLDALPIAAVMITVGDEDCYIECANEHFRLIAEWDERIGERRIAHVPILRSGPGGRPDRRLRPLASQPAL